MQDLQIIPLTDKKFVDLNPINIGRQRCVPSYSFGPYVRSNYLIHYVISGNGVLYKGDKAYNVKKGEFFVIVPGEITKYVAGSQTPWHYIWVEFNGRLSSDFSTLKSPVMQYGKSTFPDMLEAAHLNNMREELIASKLFELYSVVFERDDKLSDYEKRIYNYVASNYMSDISVEELSNMIGLSRRYMSRLFKEKTGYGVKEYIIKVRMEHAYLLLETGYSVLQAATMVGYHDVFNFSKMFKKHYGKTPASVILLSH